MADIEELLERLNDLADFSEGASGDKRAHPNNVKRVCRQAATALSAQQREIAELREALKRAKRGLTEITQFADPEEILAEPEEFGGTDDGNETVRMAYENMQFTARNCLSHVDAALNTPSQEGEKR